MFKPPSGTFSTGFLLKSVTLWGYAAGTESTRSTFPIPPYQVLQVLQDWTMVLLKIGPKGLNEYCDSVESTWLWA